MASDALRRLAARISDLSIFAGSTGSAGSTKLKTAKNCDFSGSDPGTQGGFGTGSTGSTSQPFGTHGTHPEYGVGSTIASKKMINFYGLSGDGTLGTLGTHENNEVAGSAGAAELTAEVSDATIHRRRPPSWSDPGDMPQAGDRCNCCGGSEWWIEGGPVKRGWRCNRCHPAPVPFGLRRVTT